MNTKAPKPLLPECTVNIKRDDGVRLSWYDSVKPLDDDDYEIDKGLDGEPVAISLTTGDVYKIIGGFDLIESRLRYVQVVCAVREHPTIKAADARAIMQKYDVGLNEALHIARNGR